MSRHHADGPTRTNAFEADDHATRARLGPLSNPRRRWLLRYLRERGRPATIDDVVAALPAADERTARIRLHHVDLPKLEDAGVLEYDPDRRRVRLASG